MQLAAESVSKACFGVHTRDSCTNISYANTGSDDSIFSSYER
jgi:hypothetical protein